MRPASLFRTTTNGAMVHGSGCHCVAGTPRGTATPLVRIGAPEFPRLTCVSIGSAEMAVSHRRNTAWSSLPLDMADSAPKPITMSPRKNFSRNRLDVKGYTYPQPRADVL